MRIFALILCLVMLALCVPALAFFAEGENINLNQGSVWVNKQLDSVIAPVPTTDPDAHNGSALKIVDSATTDNSAKMIWTTQAAGSFYNAAANTSSATLVVRIKTTADQAFSTAWSRNVILSFTDKPGTTSKKSVGLAIKPDKAAVVNTGGSTIYGGEMTGDNQSYVTWTIVARDYGLRWDIYRNGQPMITNGNTSTSTTESPIASMDAISVASTPNGATGSWMIDWVAVRPGEWPAWDPIADMDEGRISGTVRNAANNAAIAGAEVRLGASTPVVTDANGHYEFTGLPAGSYNVNAEMDGFYSRSAASQVVLATNKSAAVKDIKLVGKTASTQPMVFDYFNRYMAGDIGTTEDSQMLPWLSNKEYSTDNMPLATVGYSGNFFLEFAEWRQDTTHGASIGGEYKPADLDLNFVVNQIPDAIWAGVGYRQGVEQTGDNDSANHQSTVDAGYVLRVPGDRKTISLYRNNLVATGGLPAGLTLPLQFRVRAIGPHHEVWYMDTNTSTYKKVLDVFDWGKLSGGFVSMLRGGSSKAAFSGTVWFDQIEVTAEEAKPTATVTGTISDAANPATRIEGAEIEISGNGRIAQTGPSGVYTATVLAVDSIQAVASAPGYAYKPVSFDPYPGQTSTVDVAMDKLSSDKMIYDTYTRGDGDLGVTEDPAHCAWIPNSLEPAASISGGALHLGELPNGIGASPNGFTATDIDITCDVKLATTNPDRSMWAGISYRQLNQGAMDRGYMAYFRASGEVELYFINASTARAIAWGWPGGDGFWDTYHKVRIRAIGSRHEVWVDGNKIIDFRHVSEAQGGNIGLVRLGAEAWFDNFSAAIGGQAVVPPNPASYIVVDDIAKAKTEDPGTAIEISGPVVTKAFSGCFYAEDTSRASGIKVVSNQAVTEKALVKIQGTLGQANGEPIITADSVSPIGGTFDIRSLGVTGKSFVSGTELSNLGLLVRAWGRVQSVADNTCLIDDGSGNQLKVVLGGSRRPSQTNYIIATGVAGMTSGSVPALLVNSDNDLAIIP